ncbi:MAG TPA: cytochrome b/b6 domain-containing protein, partial [Burkholderiaceae bacterium]
DAPVRGLHWLLAASVVTAWISGHWPPAAFDLVHHGAGYVAGAVVLLRLLWGFAGGRYARFTQFVRAPRETLGYARQWLARREPRHVGHNPLGAWMVLTLMIVVSAATISGMLYVGDWLWGYAWLETLHAVFAWLLMVLVLAHLIGVFAASKRHGENLVGAMFSGKKRAPVEGDID